MAAPMEENAEMGRTQGKQGAAPLRARPISAVQEQGSWDRLSTHSRSPETWKEMRR